MYKSFSQRQKERMLSNMIEDNRKWEDYKKEEDYKEAERRKKQLELMERYRRRRLKQQRDRERNLHEFPEIKRLEEQKKINRIQRKKIDRLLEKIKALEHQLENTNASIKIVIEGISKEEERETIEI